MINRDFIKNIEQKVNLQKYLLDILKEIKGIENNLQPEIKKMVKKHLNENNIVEFYEEMLFKGSLGQYYTPKCISELIFKLCDKPTNKTIYEPTIGAGNLILDFYKNNNKIAGQEFDEDAFEICKLLLNDVDVKSGDTLIEPKHLDTQFDYVISNPPYGTKWEQTKHERFIGGLAPKSKSEWAFIQHCLHQMKDDGKCWMVLPHGILFRSASEGKIRKEFIEKNYIKTIISLPPNLFANTGIPVVLLELSKNKKDNDIFIIDASKNFEKLKKTNTMNEEQLNVIFKNYKERKTVEKFSSLVKVEEIKDNEYNLNIPRYVDTFEEEEPIDIDEVNTNIKELKEKIATKEIEIEEMLKELGLV